MKKQSTIYVLFLGILVSLFSCEKILNLKESENTPTSNFELFWQNMDRKYSLFTTKGINWDSLYQVYRPEVHNGMHDTALFRIMGKLIMELKDGHSDIKSSFGHIEYNYTAGYPKNFVPHIVKITYLGTREKERDGMLYSLIDSVGYVYIGSFTTEITDEGIREVLDFFSDTKGIIIDVRNNTGGNDAYSQTVINHFFDQKRYVEIKYYKSGPGHDDFRSMEQYFEPENGLGILKPIVMLTNRACYSACNSFVSWMSSLPHVSIVGDTTGGGGGTPHFSELPNGWIYRYSANKSYRPDGLNMDEGIPPDHFVTMSKRDSIHWKDTLIEFALDLIHQPPQ
jgi:hypothetical protein